MSTYARWVLPCYLTRDDNITDPIVFDLTHHLKLILANKVWERKFNYGWGYGLKNTEIENIKKAMTFLYPRFVSGYFNENRVSEIIYHVCGELPSISIMDGFKIWPKEIGVAIIEIEYFQNFDSIPSGIQIEDFKKYIHGSFDWKPLQIIYNQHIAVLKEISSLILAGLHLSFPTESWMSGRETVYDGYYQLCSQNKTFYEYCPTNAFMHEILFETKKTENVILIMDTLSKVWHFNLWPIKRYLRAVKSDQVDMDNLLDLLYALEGLFDKNTSIDFIQTMCMVRLCKNKTEALEMREYIKLSFEMRNEIAHGGLTFDPHDTITLGGKKMLRENIYWKMKGIVSWMIVEALSKMVKTEGMKNLRFTKDDLIEIIFS